MLSPKQNIHFVCDIFKNIFLKNVFNLTPISCPSGPYSQTSMKLEPKQYFVFKSILENIICKVSAILLMSHLLEESEHNAATNTF